MSTDFTGPEHAGTAADALENHPVVTNRSKDVLTPKQVTDYRQHREDFIKWLIAVGKNPKRAEGYSEFTVKRTAYRTDQFNRRVWQQEGGYTATFTHEHADAFMQELAFGEGSSSHKANTQKSIKRYFKWAHFQRGGDLWEPEVTFSSSAGSDGPRDFLTLEERKKIREAALNYGSVPSYNGLTPEERDKWRAYLAQALGKPKSEVTPADWERANDWKHTSLAWVSLDAGLRPCEVERARTSWVDIENRILRIPREDSAKNRGDWQVSLTDRTTDSLARWLREREQYEEYEGTDRLWLNRRGNPYQTHTLRYFLHRLCDMAGIPTENRRMSWYSLRHSVGTYLTNERDLAAAKAQLRHKSAQTTMKYDQVPVEDRRDALDRMG